MTNTFLTRHPEFHAMHGLNEAHPSDGVIVGSAAEVSQAKLQGFQPEQIFFVLKGEAVPHSILQDCRFVARGLYDLKILNNAAEAVKFSGMIKVGLRLQAGDFPHCGNAVELADLPIITREIKSMPYLTVRGCFFSGDLTGIHGKMLGRFFRAGYETAKRMTVTLPCAMPYICYENALSAIEENAAQHPETLDDCLNAIGIMAMQNETAFYAKLWIT